MRRHLQPGGRFIVSTPNSWYPQARLQFFLRGFFPGFPCPVGQMERGRHMHIIPWSFPQLFLFLKLAGFGDVTLHDIDAEQKPKKRYENILGLPQALYCRNKFLKARTEEERSFWGFAGSPQSLFGRRLVVSATAPGPADEAGTGCQAQA